jgi:O-antigen/teichoic acid export membrane protein
LTSTAPAPGPARSVLASIGDVIATSAVSRGVGVIRGLVLARILAPEIYGISTTVAIALAYGNYLDLGMANAAFREAAAARGRGDREGAARAAGHIGMVKIVAGVLLATAAVVLSLRGDLVPDLTFALRFLVLIGPVAALVVACQLHLQAFGHVRDANVTTTAGALIDLAIGIPLTVVAGIRGLLVGTLISQGVAFLWARSRTPGALATPLPFSVARHYLGVGVPVAALGFIDHHLVYLDHLVVLAFFSVRELGLYNVALTAADALRLFTVAIGFVIGPRLIAAYARSGGRIDAVRSHTLTPVRLVAAVLPFAIVALWVLGAYVVGRHYPAYGQSIRPMQVLIASYYFLIVQAAVTTFLFAINRHARVLFFLVPALLFNVAADVLLVRAGFGLLAIAMGSALTYALYCTALLGYVVSYFRPSAREWLSIAADAAGPGLWLLGVLLLVERMPYRDSFGGAVGAVLTGWALLSPLAWRAKRFAAALNACD